jgi:hypothetical protein
MFLSGDKPVSSPQHAPMVMQNSPKSLPHHWSVLRAITAHHQRKAYLIDQGIVSKVSTSICRAKGPFPATAAMVVVLVVFLHRLESILNPLYLTDLKS